jgi:sugar/nucleoside kinase (ribokinase family)
MSVIVLGTVALDTVKTPKGSRTNLLGGSAAHFAMGARFFAPVNLVAVIGEDFPGAYIEFLRNKNIVLTSLIQTKGSTFRWQGEYQGDLNSALTINTELGVLSTFRPRIHPAQKNIKNVFLANIDPEIQTRFLEKIYSPRLVGLDSMNYWICHKPRPLMKLMRRVDIFVANDMEARQLSGEYNLVKAAKFLAKRGPRMILIKKGEHGILFHCHRFIFSLPAYPTEKIVDPTGAGDTFAGGFMGYLAKAKRINASVLKKAFAYGTVLASFNVEGFGLTVTARLNISEVNKRLRQFERIIRL